MTSITQLGEDTRSGGWDVSVDHGDCAIFDKPYGLETITTLQDTEEGLRFCSISDIECKSIRFRCKAFPIPEEGIEACIEKAFNRSEELFSHVSYYTFDGKFVAYATDASEVLQKAYELTSQFMDDVAHGRDMEPGYEDPRGYLTRTN